MATTAKDRVLDIINLECRRMTPADYKEFLEELLDDLDSKREAVEEELKDV